MRIKEVIYVRHKVLETKPALLRRAQLMIAILPVPDWGLSGMTHLLYFYLPLALLFHFLVHTSGTTPLP